MSSDSYQNSPRRKSSDRSRSRQKERKNHYDNRQKRVKMKIPELSANLCSFKQFSSLQIDRINPEILQKGYEKYKKQWEQQQNIQFFNESKNEAWFNQKYNPELLDLQEKEKKENIKKMYTQFVSKFQQGFYDKINLAVGIDTSKLGSTAPNDQEQDNPNSEYSFINNQTIDVNLHSHIDITKSPFYGYNLDYATLFVRSLPKTISKYDIKTIVEKFQGFKYITMSEPLKKFSFSRNCWIQFDNQENCQKALLTMTGLIIKNETINVIKTVSKHHRIKILKNYPISRLQSDIDTLIKLIKKFDQFYQIKDNELLNKNYNSLQIQYDTYLIYLRKIHAFDYFTCTHYQSQRVLSSKLGSIFLRIEADYQQIPNLQTVFKKIQENSELKLVTLIQPPQYMNLVREQVQKFIRQYQKIGQQQTKQTWKCIYCQKKFKSCQFLSKHMIIRHEEIKNKKVSAIMEFLYYKDPNKITKFNQREDNKFRKPFGNNFGYRRQKKRQAYKDFDEPEGEVKKTMTAKPMVNFLDI